MLVDHWHMRICSGIWFCYGVSDMSNITIPRQILIDAKRDFESHVAPHMLERTCPAYRQITAVLSEDYKPRTVSTLMSLFAQGKPL